MNKTSASQPLKTQIRSDIDRTIDSMVLNPVVAVYKTHEEAESAIHKLQQAGFDMTKLSIVGKDYHSNEQVVGYYNAGDRMKYWGKLGAFWGGIWGVMMGAAFFWVPGIGPLLIAGPFVAAILGALEGAAVVGGISVISAGLYSLGIPKDGIVQYETAISAGKYVVIAHVTESEASKARNLLTMTDPEVLNAH